MSDFKLSQEERATLQHRVTTKLRAAIIKGELKNGTRLVQEEWAEKLGVSRMPIREALRQLEFEGLVKIEPRRGAIVTSVSIEDIEEIYQLRAILEGIAAQRSLPLLEKEDIEELEKLVDQMVRLKADDDDVELYMQLNARFHQVLKSGCPWTRIHMMIDMLWKGIPAYTPSVLSNHLEKSHREHTMILECVKNNDGKRLRQVVESHILRTRDDLLAYMQQKV